jgi:hypothetical protein
VPTLTIKEIHAVVNKEFINSVYFFVDVVNSVYVSVVNTVYFPYHQRLKSTGMFQKVNTKYSVPGGLLEWCNNRTEYTSLFDDETSAINLLPIRRHDGCLPFQLKLHEG